ncbi:hypothetical protein [Enterovibrio norvegicus]|uniref:hypothetical protein n=1 Tax=Enterovibrio norvegicus TaxID=188144 RepID=UPI000C84523C|nr:hypothetical protein [Enterovibrio norvegicus]PMH64482.1 hypothetical protein BCU62_15620 [Enterovibrio norvegicus]
MKLTDSDFASISEKDRLYSVLISPLTISLFLMFVVFYFGHPYALFLGLVVATVTALAMSFVHQILNWSRWGSNWKLLYKQTVDTTWYFVVKDGARRIRVIAINESQIPKDINSGDCFSNESFKSWLLSTEPAYLSPPVAKKF